MKNFNQEDIINGTGGFVWFDMEEVAEVTAFQAKDEYEKEEFRKVGSMVIYNKVTGIKRKGSIKMHHVDSMMIKKIATKIEKGEVPVFSFTSRLNGKGKSREQVQLGGVIFDDLTIADWEAGENGTIEAPFTFETLQILSTI